MLSNLRTNNADGTTPTRKSYSDLAAGGALPATPMTTATTTPQRQGILRMPSQQAEKDAVDTLLFLSSPNNSASANMGLGLGMGGQQQPSPLRAEFVGKRVGFGEGVEGEGGGRRAVGSRGRDGVVYRRGVREGSEEDSEGEIVRAGR